jgi:hypothetical protein
MFRLLYFALALLVIFLLLKFVFAIAGGLVYTVLVIAVLLAVLDLLFGIGRGPRNY